MRYKSYALHNFREIEQINNLKPEQIEAIEIVGRIFPFKTNNYVVENLIDWLDPPNCPVYTMTFPRKEMISNAQYLELKTLLSSQADSDTVKELITKIRLSLNPNPADQEYNIPMLGEIKLKGVQHKYRETVLFFPSQGQTCHAYCTFCFRWPQFSGMSELKFHMKEAELLYQYLDNHKNVTDVLFTGGDPMTMNASVLESYILPLLSDRFPQIRTIRIGTKSITYWPYRYISDSDTPQILELFKKVVDSGRNLAIQAHFNHYKEFSTPIARQAIKAILSTGAQIRTQSPLLKNINDNPHIWSTMWRQQVDLGMIPYYMFIARDTGSKKYFELPLEKCWRIYKDAYSHVSGVCRTVRGPSMSASLGKIQILGINSIKGEKVFVLRFLQAKNPKLIDVPFFAKYDPKATWFDQLEPAFGEDKFKLLDDYLP
ncbi:MAG: lysine 2,3-aminomutase [Mucinivorans sp.]